MVYLELKELEFRALISTFDFRKVVVLQNRYPVKFTTITLQGPYWRAHSNTLNSHLRYFKSSLAS